MYHSYKTANIIVLFDDLALNSVQKDLGFQRFFFFFFYKIECSVHSSSARIREFRRSKRLLFYTDDTSGLRTSNKLLFFFLTLVQNNDIHHFQTVVTLLKGLHSRPRESRRNFASD
jgi:hypothetical protein